MPTNAKQQSSQLIRGFEPYQETKGEEYMSERMRAHFTSILNKWKVELMEEVDRTVHHMQDEAANFPDPADPELVYIDSMAGDLFLEREVRSVTANTRRDGEELFKLAAKIPLRTHTQEFGLEQANEALQSLKQDRINGAAVLRVTE